uniref:G_PROTEIN_RECEP_F1_2 domain-containing protein n=1 Tax=Panagrellus redivivus TaxID=6233 RepID=A0A7E4VLB2_PANRE
MNQTSTTENNSTFSEADLQYIQNGESFQAFVYSVLMPCVCIPGMLGACISIIIFTKKQMRSSLNVYLAGLSVFDLVVLSMSLIIYPLMSECIRNGSDGTICHVFWRTSLFAYPVSLMAQTGSVWTCVAITVDRFLAVKYPLHMRLWCTPQKAICALCCITGLSILYKIPSIFELKLDENGRVHKTELRDNRLYILLYNTYGNVLILFVIPWVIIIALNVVTVNAVRAAYKIRREMRLNQRSDDNERRCTKMATVTIIAFIVFNSVAALNNVIEAINVNTNTQDAEYSQDERSQYVITLDSNEHDMRIQSM